MSRGVFTNKNEIIREIAYKQGISSEVTKGIIDQFIELIGDKMAQREKIQIVGFGTFEARFVNERNSRNPQTGEKLTIPGHFSPKFKPGKALKEKIEQQ